MLNNEHAPGIRRILLWLADCEAATLWHLSSRKSTPKSELVRHQEICKTLLASLEEGDLVASRPSVEKSVMERLKEALQNIEFMRLGKHAENPDHSSSPGR